MTPPRPLFAYPDAKHVRRHGPAGYADYKAYKPFLRDEFEFRCVYCLTRERWSSSGADIFGVDHFVAKSECPELLTQYINLLYVCNRCNSAKNKYDCPLCPDTHVMAEHLLVEDDGTVVGCTTEGEELIALLSLNSPLYKELVSVHG